MSTKRTTKKNAKNQNAVPGWLPLVDDDLNWLLPQVLYYLPINGGVELREENMKFWGRGG
jgi:hypothetical protein